MIPTSHEVPSYPGGQSHNSTVDAIFLPAEEWSAASMLTPSSLDVTEIKLLTHRIRQKYMCSWIQQCILTLFSLLAFFFCLFKNKEVFIVIYFFLKYVCRLVTIFVHHVRETMVRHTLIKIDKNFSQHCIRRRKTIPVQQAACSNLHYNCI